MEKLIINLHDYEAVIENSRLTEYRTITTINGVNLPNEDPNPTAILKQVLEHIGYEVEITETYYFNGDEDN